MEGLEDILYLVRESPGIKAGVVAGFYLGVISIGYGLYRKFTKESPEERDNYRR